MVFYIYEPQKILLWGKENVSCNLTFVNDKKKICYIFIPKNATNSMKKLTATYNETLYTENVKKYEDYKKIIVIRDPMSRIISTYNEVVKVASNETKKTEFYKNKKDIEKSFDLFLDYIKDHFYDGHICPQYLYLKMKGLKLADMDDVILFENISNETPKLKQKYKLGTGKAQVINPGKAQVKHLLNKVVHKYEQKIYNIYHKDFELYYHIKYNH